MTVLGVACGHARCTVPGRWLAGDMFYMVSLFYETFPGRSRFVQRFQNGSFAPTRGSGSIRFDHARTPTYLLRHFLKGFPGEFPRKLFWRCVGFIRGAWGFCSPIGCPIFALFFCFLLGAFGAAQFGDPKRVWGIVSAWGARVVPRFHIFLRGCFDLLRFERCGDATVDGTNSLGVWRPQVSISKRSRVFSGIRESASSNG